MKRVKKFLIGGINNDDSLKFIGDKQALNLMNCRVSASEDGKNLRIENTRGTTIVTQTVHGVGLNLGSVAYQKRMWILYAHYSDIGETGIYCYDATTGTTYKVLLNSQVTGGLGFSKSYRFDHNMKVEDDVLYMTDDNSPQWAINIIAGIKLNHSSYSTSVVPFVNPVAFSEITLIKPPTPTAPNLAKKYDAGFSNNFIANESVSFCWLYTYRENQVSVTGTISGASKLNAVADNYNYITVSMNADERIPNRVKIVQLVVRIGKNNFGNVVKTWDKSIAADLAEINAQNATPQTALSYNFYNNVTGELVPNLLKPYDSVSIKSKTLEMAKNRLFLGNNLDGYDAPLTSSLSTSLQSVTISAASFSTNLIQVYVVQPNSVTYSAWYVYLTNVAPFGYYEIISTKQTGTVIPPPLPAAPTSVAFSGLRFMGEAQADVIYKVQQEIGAVAITNNTFNFTSSACTITSLTTDTYNVLKPRAQYAAGVVFMDFAMRRCSVFKKPSADVFIPDRNFDFTTGKYAITWALSNTNALNEIPDWAYYVAVVRTLNLRTRFFIEFQSRIAKYATKDLDNKYVYTYTTFVTQCVAIAFDTTGMVQAGLGYTYTEGDIAHIIDDAGTVYEFPVIGQDGKYILVKPQDIGAMTTNRGFMIEIFTPYKTSDQEPFFDFGGVYKIDNPTTSLRAYHTLSGIFSADAFALSRSFSSFTYFASAMSPNDIYYRRWDTGEGKPYLFTKLGQARNSSSICFSDIFFAGTANNGLSTFEPLNRKTLPQESGEIQKLQLASKVQEDGSVMLAICTSETESIYLGETQLMASAKAANVAVSDGVIGTINTLKGNSGTRIPSSVVMYNGLVWWFDDVNGRWTQYSSNGLYTISNFGMERFFKKYAKEYASTSTGLINNLNGFTHIPSGIDPYNKELLCGIPALTYENYVTSLPSYSTVPSYATSIKNRFDPYDKLAKTFAFKYEGNNWGSNFEFLPEQFETMDDILYAFKAGKLYIHDTDSENTNRYYGVTKPVRIMVVANEGMSAIKDMMNIAIEGSVAPDFTVVYSNNPNIQISDLVSTDYTNDEGVLCAPILLDRLSPNAAGTADQKLYTGDIVKGATVMVMCEFQQYTGLMWVDALYLGFELSTGMDFVNIPIKQNG